MVAGEDDVRDLERRRKQEAERAKTEDERRQLEDEERQKLMDAFVAGDFSKAMELEEWEVRRAMQTIVEMDVIEGETKTEKLRRIHRATESMLARRKSMLAIVSKELDGVEL